jgi:hypothetical protein
MKIAAVPVTPAPAGGAGSQVFSFRIEGSLQSSDEIVKRARELIMARGSADMLESFDWAISNGALLRPEAE